MRGYKAKMLRKVAKQIHEATEGSNLRKIYKALKKDYKRGHYNV